MNSFRCFPIQEGKRKRPDIPVRAPLKPHWANPCGQACDELAKIYQKAIGKKLFELTNPFLKRRNKG